MRYNTGLTFVDWSFISQVSSLNTRRCAAEPPSPDWSEIHKHTQHVTADFTVKVHIHHGESFKHWCPATHLCLLLRPRPFHSSFISSLDPPLPHQLHALVGRSLLVQFAQSTRFMSLNPFLTACLQVWGAGIDSPLAVSSSATRRIATYLL